MREWPLEEEVITLEDLNFVKVINRKGGENIEVSSQATYQPQNFN